jgi:asparagine synthase (glutamine-hydrolysing)
LLDHELLELAARIPSSLKVRRGETKWIFKKAFEDRLPAEIVRRPKHGFELPLDSWLRGPLRETLEDAVLARQSPLGNLVNQPVARELYQSHLSGQGRHGAVLWSLLILGCWAKRYLTVN